MASSQHGKTPLNKYVLYAHMTKRRGAICCPLSKKTPKAKQQFNMHSVKRQSVVTGYIVRRK